MQHSGSFQKKGWVPVSRDRTKWWRTYLPFQHRVVFLKVTVGGEASLVQLRFWGGPPSYGRKRMASRGQSCQHLASRRWHDTAKQRQTFWFSNTSFPFHQASTVSLRLRFLSLQHQPHGSINSRHPDHGISFGHYVAGWQSIRDRLVMPFWPYNSAILLTNK